MNQRGSFGRGGAACEVKSDRCLLAGTDFLRAMAVDFGYRSEKSIEKMKIGDETTANILVEEK